MLINSLKLINNRNEIWRTYLNFDHVQHINLVFLLIKFCVNEVFEVDCKIPIFRDYRILVHSTHKKMKSSIKNFFNKYDQIRRKLLIWSHLPTKYLMGNIFSAVLMCWVVPIIQIFHAFLWNFRNYSFEVGPAGIFLLKVNRNTRASCEICSSVVLVHQLLTLKIFCTLFQCFYC